MRITNLILIGSKPNVSFNSADSVDMEYIQGSPTFTVEQRLFYEKNGFVVIRNNVDPVLLDKLCQRFIDICEGKADDYMAVVVKDPVLKKKGATGQYAVNKMQDFLYDDVLWEYSSNKAVLDIVEQIIGPNITVMHSIILNKPPNSDPDISRHPLHQDLYYSPWRPADKAVTSWTAMERVDERNGCLYVVPGTHKGPLYEHDYPETGRHAVYHEIKGIDNPPKLHIVMEKGDTIYTHPLLFHGSGPNLTQGFRKAILSHYVDSNCELINFANTVQEKMAKEYADIVKKRIGKEVRFENFLIFQSRLVRGSPGKIQQMASHL